jgi:molecular chaperone GrpE
MKKVDMNTVDNEKTENVDVEVNDTNEVEASENQEPKDEQQQETAENAETAETEQQDPLEAAKAEIEELKKQALYKQAEFENFRKRTLKEKADLILAGGEKAITAILPVLDDFERALADKSDDANAIREGMELIFQKFQKTLESLGVKKIETEGADFNVDYHESIALVPGMGEDKKGKVIDCVQTGYTLNDKVIRFAKVAVGQ